MILNKSLNLKLITSLFKRILLIYFCFFSVNLNAQDDTIDSLRFKIKTARHDTTLCIALTELGEYIYSKNPDSAIVLWQKVLKISTEKLKTTTDKNSRNTFSFLLARTYQNFGSYYQAHSGAEEGFKYFKKSLALNIEREDTINIANCFVDIGIVYYRRGDILQALEYYHKALKIFEKSNSRDDLAFCLVNIGNLYVAQNDLENALKYLNRSVKIYESLNDNAGLALALSVISSIYKDKGDPNCKEQPAVCDLKNKEKALKGYLKILDLWINENNDSGIATVCLSISSLYNSQNNPTKALVYANRALSINESLNSKQGISASFGVLANIMFDKGDVNEAEKFANKNMSIAKDLGYPKDLIAASIILKKIYEKQHNYKGALEMHELTVKMRDSVNNETTRKLSIKKQFEFVYAKQAEKDSILNVAKLSRQQAEHEHAISQQRIYTYSVIAGFIMMLIIAIISFKAYKTKQKANRTITKQNHTIEIANKDLERQHILNQKIFSVISHDFRGPILSLNLVLDKFKESSSDEKLNKYLKDIGASVHTANTVLNNLLNWANAEINLNSSNEAKCLIAPAVSKVRLEFMEKLEEKKIEFIGIISEDAKIELPADILIITLRNLVSNAIKFSNTESKIIIAFDATSKTLSVKDNGLGISEEKLKLLFKQQVNSEVGTQKEQGFGIGLYIVSELLHKYNYSLKAESKEIEGTVFTIFRNKLN